MLIKRALLRGCIPLVIMTVISLIMKHQGMDSFQVKSTFLAGLILTFVVAASVIYDVEGWSLMKQSGIHFLLMLITVYPCLLISGWFKLNDFLDYLKVLGFFMLVGLVLWSICYLIFGKWLAK